MSVSEPQSKFVRLGELNLHYLEWGEATRPPMVFLHGWGDTAWLFKRVARFFEKDYRVLALDLRGHGETSQAEPAQNLQAATLEDLGNFLNELDLHNVVLVGYSYGGTVAHRYVADHPERFKALGIIDIGVNNTAVTFDANASPEKVQASVERAWERFRKLKLPTLVIQAEQSHLLQLEMAQQMVAAIPNGHLTVIKEADHKIFRRYTEVAEALQKFLQLTAPQT